jgi:uncharacterized protein (TIGR00299 family) protein
VALFAYLDAFSGISGNMLLGALLELGWPRQELLSLPDRLGLSGLSIKISKVSRAGISGTAVELEAPGQPERHLSQIRRQIEQASLPRAVREKAIETFELLADAEARVHGVARQQVHFHEVGAADALVDIVGAVLGFHHLGVERIFSSPLPLSRGFVRCAHGLLPLPAPAVLELLKEAVVTWQDAAFEFVTPTGAALMRTLSEQGPPAAVFRLKAIGYGAGTRHLEGRPNLLRVILYEDGAEQKGPGLPDALLEEVIELRSVMDDMNPEITAFLCERLFGAGALDVWVVPVQMKKGRAGVELVCLARPEKEAALCEVIFKESSTSGIRVVRQCRRILKRRQVVIETPFGPVKAKEILRPGGEPDIVPEYEECRAISNRLGVPLRQVYKAVLASGQVRRSSLQEPGGHGDKGA